MDDGSKEECAHRLDQIITGYPNANVYHLPYSGAANARNKGIRRAKGTYICFADADDIVTRQFLFDLVELKKYACDYDIVYGLVHYVKKGTEWEEDDHTDSLELNPIDATGYRELYRHMFDLGSPSFRKNGGYVSRGPVARLVKRELAEKIFSILIWSWAKMSFGIWISLKLRIIWLLCITIGICIWRI